jgi:hypothetical protein
MLVGWFRTMSKARGDLPDSTADLSEAARAVVRDAGDPRTDAYLAALGLVDAPATAEPQPVVDVPAAALEPAREPKAEQLSFAMPAAEPVASTSAADAAELARLTARVAELEGSLTSAASRARTLTIAVVILVIAVAALLILQVAIP